MCKCHRDAPEIPTDPAERKAMIKWLIGHPLWTHPGKSFKVPPENINIDPIDYAEGKIDDSNWPEEIWPEGSIYECVNFSYHYVNPETECIEDDDSLNTLFQVWVEEAGGWYDLSKTEDGDILEPDGGWNDYNKWRLAFDLRLEVGGNSMEDCLLELAVRVKAFYNDDGSNRNGYWCETGEWDEAKGEYKSTCEDAGDGYCKNCGYPIND